MARIDGLTLPDFIGIGPARTGTTWLHEVLEQRVCLPYGLKETAFFNRNYSRGIEWYARNFERCDRYRLVGEICPYFSAPNAPERIERHLGRIKLLCTLRDPVERAYSYYRLMRRYVWTRHDFERALDEHRQPAEGNRYAHHLKRWFERFGRERVLVLLYDDLRADPQGYIDAITGFIGVERIDVAGGRIGEAGRNAAERAPKNRKLAQNARHVLFWLEDRRAFALINLLEKSGVWRFCFERGDVFAPLDPEVDARVRARFRPEVEALEKLLGRDLSKWKEPPVGHPSRAERASA